MELTGIHHLTAVSANIRENYRFYTKVLGMRLVKRSVNQDDVKAYHLFYADAVGSSGTDLTFFDWAMPREKRGTHSITRTALRVNGSAALTWWEQHLKEQNVNISEKGVTKRDGHLTLDFEDGEGQRLCLIDDAGQGDSPVPWEQSPVPAAYQVRGLGPITMSVPELELTNIILTRVMNFRAVREYADGENTQAHVHVYEMGQGGPHAELHVAVEPNLPPAQLGAGGVHHVAFRTPNDEQYHAWAKHLKQLGIPNSGEVERYYFRSLYFREPNGILFEIATDGPGFGVDENAETLGEKIALPPFLEPRRAEILANLKPLE